MKDVQEQSYHIVLRTNVHVKFLCNFNIKDIEQKQSSQKAAMKCLMQAKFRANEYVNCFCFVN